MHAFDRQTDGQTDGRTVGQNRDSNAVRMLRSRRVKIDLETRTDISSVTV